MIKKNFLSLEEGGGLRSKSEGVKPAKEKRSASFAHDMRNNPTNAEQKLWWVLKNEKTTLGKFRRQHPFGKRFIADFISLEHKLIIEVEGEGHNPTNDSAWDNFMNQEGYQVLRFTSDDLRMPYAIQKISSITTATPSVALRAPPPPSRGRKISGTIP